MAEKQKGLVKKLAAITGASILMAILFGSYLVGFIVGAALVLSIIHVLEYGFTRGEVKWILFVASVGLFLMLYSSFNFYLLKNYPGLKVAIDEAIFRQIKILEHNLGDTADLKATDTLIDYLEEMGNLEIQKYIQQLQKIIKKEKKNGYLTEEDKSQERDVITKLYRISRKDSKMIRLLKIRIENHEHLSDLKYLFESSAVQKSQPAVISPPIYKSPPGLIPPVPPSVKELPSEIPDQTTPEVSNPEVLKINQREIEGGIETEKSFSQTKTDNQTETKVSDWRERFETEEEYYRGRDEDLARQRREWEEKQRAEDEKVIVLKVERNILPAWTELIVRIKEKIVVNPITVGREFQAFLEKPVVINNKVLLEKDLLLLGIIVRENISSSVNEKEIFTKIYWFMKNGIKYELRAKIDKNMRAYEYSNRTYSTAIMSPRLAYKFVVEHDTYLPK